VSEMVKIYGHRKGTTILLKPRITIYDSKGSNEEKTSIPKINLRN